MSEQRNPETPTVFAEFGSHVQQLTNPRGPNAEDTPATLIDAAVTLTGNHPPKEIHRLLKEAHVNDRLQDERDGVIIRGLLHNVALLHNEARRVEDAERLDRVTRVGGTIVGLVTAVALEAQLDDNTSTALLVGTVAGLGAKKLTKWVGEKFS